MILIISAPIKATADKEKIAIEMAISKILGNNYNKNNILFLDSDLLKKKDIENLNLSRDDVVIFNSDYGKPEIIDIFVGKFLSYGFGSNADFLAEEIKESQEGINFKILHQGNAIPFWIKKVYRKEDIYPFLAAVAVGELCGINLVQSSQALIQ